jgi:hypothetical protein
MQAVSSSEALRRTHQTTPCDGDITAHLHSPSWRSSSGSDGRQIPKVRFITVFTTARQWQLSSTNTLPHNIIFCCRRSILIFFYPHPVISSEVFPSGFKIWAFLIPPCGLLTPAISFSLTTQCVCSIWQQYGHKQWTVKALLLSCASVRNSSNIQYKIVNVQQGK